MKTLHALTVSLLAATLAVGCAAQSDDSANEATAATSNFSIPDNYFDSMITVSRLYATTDCADFGIVAGEGLEIWPGPKSFAITHAAGAGDFTPGPDAFRINVPSDGDYVWETFVGRSTNRIVSESLGQEAFTPNDGSGAITLRKLGPDAEACVLGRCAAFGPCH